MDIKQNKIKLWEEKMSAAQKQLKIAQSLQVECLGLIKEAQNLEIEERSKIMGNLTMSLAKSQSMENEAYDRITTLQSSYPY